MYKTLYVKLYYKLWIDKEEIRLNGITMKTTE